MGNKLWTKTEESYVRQNYKKLTAKQIAAKLKRTVGSVNWKISDLGLPYELNNTGGVKRVPVTHIQEVKRKVKVRVVKKGFFARLFSRG